MPEHRLSDRALCIVGGLIKTGRVAVMPPGSMTFWRGYARLDRASGGFFWLACDGTAIRRGRDVTESEALSDTFRHAMERIGQPRRGLDVPAPVKSCLASMA
jgi:hypothetical protein